MFGPIVIEYAPSVVCAGKVMLSVLFELVQLNPLICANRFVPPGPVKLETSLATEKLPVFIGSSKLKAMLVRFGFDTVPVGFELLTNGSNRAAGTSKFSTTDVELELAVDALTPQPRPANARQISFTLAPPVSALSAARIASRAWRKLGLLG